MAFTISLLLIGLLVGIIKAENRTKSLGFEEIEVPFSFYIDEEQIFTEINDREYVFGLNLGYRGKAEPILKSAAAFLLPI